jgi:hypothetical protein
VPRYVSAGPALSCSESKETLLHRHRTRKLPTRKTVEITTHQSWKVDLDDEALLCTDYEYCGKKKPHLHPFLTGFCTVWPEDVIVPDSHHKCPGVMTTRGGRKTIYCKCPCHQ